MICFRHHERPRELTLEDAARIWRAQDVFDAHAGKPGHSAGAFRDFGRRLLLAKSARSRLLSASSSSPAGPANTEVPHCVRGFAYGLPRSAHARKAPQAAQPRTLGIDLPQRLA
jgi:hypothetical protein